MTDDLERFLAHVDRAGSVVPGMNLRCWKWTGAVDRDGRPRFRLGGRSMLAMEFAARAYMLVHRGGHMDMEGRLGARVVLRAGHYSRRPGCARCTERLCHGCGRLGYCTDAQGRS